MAACREGLILTLQASPYTADQSQKIKLARDQIISGTLLVLPLYGKILAFTGATDGLSAHKVPFPKDTSG